MTRLLWQYGHVWIILLLQFKVEILCEFELDF